MVDIDAGRVSYVAMKCTMEIDEKTISDLFTSLVPAAKFEAVRGGIEDFLGFGAVVKVMQNDTVINQFTAPGEFLAYTDNLRAWVGVQFTKVDLHGKTVEFRLPHRKVDGHGKFDVLGPNPQGLLSITIHSGPSDADRGYIFLLSQIEADVIVKNASGSRFDFSCMVVG